MRKLLVPHPLKLRPLKNVVSWQKTLGPPSGPTITSPRDAISNFTIIRVKMSSFGRETQTPLVTSQAPVATEVSHVDFH